VAAATPEPGEAAAAAVAGEADAGVAVAGPALTPATLSSYERRASLSRLASRTHRVRATAM
jgi:hypothetical protein